VFFALGTLASSGNQMAQFGMNDAPAMVSFDKSGKLETSLDGLWKANGPAPTHIILLAHGWNNSKMEAGVTYRKMAQLLAKGLAENPRQPQKFVPLFVGVRWPSLAWEDDKGFDFAVGELEKVLQENVHPRFQELATVLLDRLEQLNDANPLLIKLGLGIVKKRFPDLDFDPVILLDAKLFEKKNLSEVIRVFSFYEMKKRAGIVGKEGAYPLLSQLQKRFPNASLHLIGHSFGCKLWLNALADKELSRPIDSLVLLQAAVSQHAFAETLPFLDEKISGAYWKVPRRVSGPIVATFSKQDHPLTYAYPLASLAAGHVGEVPLKQKDLDAEAYSALGAKGFGDAGTNATEKDGRYLLRRRLYSLDAEAMIAGHSGFINDAVARLISAAVFHE
jgi:hypothetical protein